MRQLLQFVVKWIASSPGQLTRKFVNCAEAQKLAKLIVKELTVVIVLMIMRMCDSGKLCAGKLWIHSHGAHEKLVQSLTFGVSIEEYPDLTKIPDLFMKAWDKYHHQILSLAYALNPEYHRMKPWLDPTVKKD